jgi:hypothetical protein
MKLGTLRRLASSLLLVGAVAIFTTGCLMVPVPFPVGGGGHGHHGRSHRW